MRIHIAIVGINRSLRFTAHSIRGRLIAPLQRLPWVTLSTSLTLIKPPGNLVSNARSGEEGELDNFVPDFLPQAEVYEIEQNQLDKDIFSRFSFFDSLDDPWEDNKKSLMNLFRFLMALEKTFSNLVAPLQPDVVIFLRPDLLIADRLYPIARLLHLKLLSTLNSSAVILPTWGRQRGLNDRFAILSSAATKLYFLRARQLSADFFKAGSPNSEKLLKNAMKHALVSSSIYSRMPRIRIGGEIAYRDKPMMRSSALGFRASVYRARLHRIRRLISLPMKRVLKSKGHS